MPPDQLPSPTRRADAERNRDKILAAARSAFADPEAEISMAEISRRAGVGMATLYRNFPGRRELLEALYTGEVDAVCEAAKTAGGGTPGAILTAWLHRFFAFATSKRHIAAELLEHTDRGNPLFDNNRARVIAAGRPLLAAAQRAHEIRDDLALEQVLDMVIAIATIHGNTRYLEPILRTALDGLRPPADVKAPAVRAASPAEPGPDAERPVVVDYTGDWPGRAASLIATLRDKLGARAVRIEHIGSTAIPGMAAKDVLDLQVSVTSLEDANREFGQPLGSLGFRRTPYERDHIPAGWQDDQQRWVKRLWARRGHPGGDVNLHVRLAGSPNERLALLFRDWFRAHPQAVPAYAAFKRSLAAAAPDIAIYSGAKDPVVDLVITVADPWAAATGWQP